MTNTPPPFQPPYQGPPPRSAAPGGAVQPPSGVPPPPAWQTVTSTSLTPGAAPETSGKRPLIIGGVVVAEAIDLDPAVGEGIDGRSAREEGDLPGFVSCQRNAVGETTVDRGPTSVFFQAVLEPPRDDEGYIMDFAGDVTEINFDDTVDYKGGTVYMFCAEAIGDAGCTGCDAEWVDTENKIALNMFLGGDDATPEETFTALKAVLAMISASLAELAGNES